MIPARSPVQVGVSGTVLLESSREVGRDALDDGALAAGFDAFVAAAGPRLLGLALALTGERATAEDLLQEALTRTWGRRRELGGFQAIDELQCYVAQALRNLAANRRDRLAVEARALALRAPSPPSAATGGGPDAERIAKLIARLPDEQREVVLLRLHEELSWKEIAARAGAPLGTVQSRYRLALERLKPLLEHDA